MERQRTAAAEHKRQSENKSAHLDLTQAANTPTYQQAIALLEKLTGKPALRPPELPALALCPATTAGAESLLEKHREAFRALNAFPFIHETPTIPALDNPTFAQTIALLPTPDQFEAVAALPPNTANQGLSVRRLLTGLKRIATDHAPYTITHLSHDSLTARFHTPPPNPKKLAALLYKICPDVIDQGFESTQALAKDLQQTNHFHLWWD